MRILILSDANSAHTRKWAISLAASGLEIGVFSFRKSNTDWTSDQPNIKLFDNHNADTNVNRILSKIGYLFLLPKLKNTIKEFSPDIVHAHYATSYGLLGRLSDFHPFYLSVWGSDVMEFPLQNPIFKYLVKCNLQKADSVFATSKVLVEAVKQLSGVTANLVYWGVETEVFKNIRKNYGNDSESVVLGTVKSLESVYRIDLIIQAFSIALKKQPNMKLLIVGGGSLAFELKHMVSNLGISDNVTFTGKVPSSAVLEYHNKIDVFANVSDRESFGVSVLEASACENPVIISRTGGLPEVVVENETGFIINPGDTDALVSCILTLSQNKELRIKMGKAGRDWVKSHFEWNQSVKEMTNYYESCKISSSL